MLLISIQIPEIPLTSISFKKCHLTNDFVPKIPSPLGFHSFHGVKIL